MMALITADANDQVWSFTLCFSSNLPELCLFFSRSLDIPLCSLYTVVLMVGLVPRLRAKQKHQTELPAKWVTVARQREEIRQ